KIASVVDWTNSREWSKEPSEKSVGIFLVAGQKYYVEVLQKEGSGGDNVAVGWAKPGQASASPSEVIPGEVLTPWTGGNVAAAASTSKTQSIQPIRAVPVPGERVGVRRTTISNVEPAGLYSSA